MSRAYRELQARRETLGQAERRFRRQVRRLRAELDRTLLGRMLARLFLPGR